MQSLCSFNRDLADYVVHCIRQQEQYRVGRASSILEATTNSYRNRPTLSAYPIDHLWTTEGQLYAAADECIRLINFTNNDCQSKSKTRVTIHTSALGLPIANQERREGR